MTTTRVLERSCLTAKQKAFCVYYFEMRNGTQAAIRAGYSPRTADVISTENLRKPSIMSYLAELEAKVESDAIGTVSERKKRLTEIYRANLTDFCDKDGNITLKPSAALAEVVIEEGRDGKGETKRLKLRDPIAAIQEQNKMERVGAENTMSQNINVIFVVGKGYREEVASNDDFDL